MAQCTDGLDYPQSNSKRILCFTHDDQQFREQNIDPLLNILTSYQWETSYIAINSKDAFTDEITQAAQQRFGVTFIYIRLPGDPKKIGFNEADGRLQYLLVTRIYHEFRTRFDTTIIMIYESYPINLEYFTIHDDLNINGYHNVANLPSHVVAYHEGSDLFQMIYSLTENNLDVSILPFLIQRLNDGETDIISVLEDANNDMPIEIQRIAENTILYPVTL